MSLDKVKQKLLFKWLKQQAGFYKTSLRLSVLTGVISGLLIIVQAWLLATILQRLIMDGAGRADILPYFFGFLITLLLRVIFVYLREQINFFIGAKIRRSIREQVLNTLEQQGPAYINQKTTGSWSTLLIEQIEDLQDFYSRYLPQMRLAAMIPLFILVAILPVNWAAAVILFITAPLIPLFMALVGMGAADVNKRNFLALNRLSGHFLDRLRSIETIRLFNQGKKQTEEITEASENFRTRTMEVLKMAFLSSGVLEFFASVSIAVVAVYFGFSYLGELNFGSYGLGVTLFAGFFALILAPEFFQPLRDLGTYYHAKAQAVAAADSIYDFLSESSAPAELQSLETLSEPFSQIVAKDLVILSHTNQPIAGPFSFTLQQGQQVAIIGKSGEGKTSLINVLLGFLPYQGSLKISNIELNQIDKKNWRQQLSWVGQNPNLPAKTIRDNILLAAPDTSEQHLSEILQQAYVDEFTRDLPDGLDTVIGDDATRLSIGQAQRIAVARALLKPASLLLLDEPTASLDKLSAEKVKHSLQQAGKSRTVLMITHQTDKLDEFSHIWQIQNNQLIVLKGEV
ncbi:heme ABC transporter permease/ATP-binding protein CydD [Zophobihabitans entericus]|uniref:Cysteine/glutathione ABC transporter permease/ATP-binding protein CydD n=1 Tax=Zophobihabitans entericus TaxID=1635327 RepID=A0A6G9I9P0_9GAMM|nr:cysteine/glutathione ABC transporter permease/ATP-binding protein CydD [Zophobihabitans entericus]QIQ20936.1 cysteine/glutathione ABC transporter permease/ATP-binding protein CydD [Zophobihabitans entericus]